MKADKSNAVGLVAYKKIQRGETLYRIDEGIKYLREKGLQITKTSIAAEIGIHRNTMNQEYVRVHLLQYPEFNTNFQMPALEKISVEEYTQRIALLKDKLAKIQGTKDKLTAENLKLKLENKTLLDKYQRLLGQYQIDAGKKIVPF